MRKIELLGLLEQVPDETEISVVLQRSDAEEGSVLLITDFGFGPAGHVLYVEPVDVEDDD